MADGPAALDTKPPLWRSVMRWEGALGILLVASIIYGAVSTTSFLSQDTVFFAGLNFGLIAIMALPEMAIIMTGEVDLSVAAMLGLASSCYGYLYEHHVMFILCVVLTLVVGAVGGALNGFLVTKVGLPSIAVTIGTLTMFRGLAEVVLGTNEVTSFAGPWTNIGTSAVPGTPFSYTTVIFFIMAVVYGAILHFTVTGRSIYAIGLQQDAAYFSGVRVKRIKFNLYLMAGIISAFAGILYTYQTNSARYDAGLGLELNVVAIVLFGGVSIFGGRGTLPGVLLSVLAVGTFDQVLTIKNVSSQEQSIVFGLLLLASVLLPNAAAWYGALRAKMTKQSGLRT